MSSKLAVSLYYNVLCYWLALPRMPLNINSTYKGYILQAALKRVPQNITQSWPTWVKLWQNKGILSITRQISRIRTICHLKLPEMNYDFSKNINYIKEYRNLQGRMVTICTKINQGLIVDLTSVSLEKRARFSVYSGRLHEAHKLTVGQLKISIEK